MLPNPQWAHGGTAAVVKIRKTGGCKGAQATARVGGARLDYDSATDVATLRGNAHHLWLIDESTPRGSQ